MSLLRFEVHVPDSRSDAAYAAMRGAPHSINITRHAGASLDPPGDVLMCDIPRESASGLLESLRTAGACDASSNVAILDGISHISERAEAAAVHAPGAGQDALIWPVVRGRLDEETELSATFIAFMVLATMMAAVGIVTDSAILIVGSMVLGPEFGPIARLCVAVIDRDWRRALDAWRTATIGFVAAFALTAVFSIAMIALGIFPSTPPTSGLGAAIANTNTLAFIVSLIAGVAGTLSLTSARSGALIGVLISVTTIPAVGDAAVLASHGEWNDAWGALLMLAVNLTGIAIAGTITLAAHSWILRRRATPNE